MTTARAVSGTTGEEALLVLIPVFNDWDCVEVVLAELDRVLQACGRRADALLVDDASTDALGEGLAPRGAIASVRVLHLRCNLGHERAICVGLSYAHDHMAAETVVIMDGDGEDRPEDIPRLLDELEREGGRCVVFAARLRRSENLIFRLGYLFYQLIHRLLVGRPIEVGSFSALPRRILSSLVVMPQLWNHYAAAVAASRTPWISIPTHRGARIRGESRLDLIALVVHGISALSVYSERIAVRVLLASAVVGSVISVALGALLFSQWSADAAVSGWAVALLVGFSVALLLIIALAASFSVMTLSTRSRAHFVPLEGCPLYVRELREL
jgi:hypothetical protein